MRVVLVTPPEGLPVSLVEAKQHLRVDHSEEDALITSQIRAAVDTLDGYSGTLGRCLLTQVWAVHLDGWWDVVRLPFSDARDIVVTYRDADGEEQEVDPGLFTYAYWNTGYGIRFEVLFTRPPLWEGTDYPVTVTFTAGYGPAGDVPDSIKQAILLHVEAMHDRLPPEQWRPTYDALVGTKRAALV